MVFESLVVDLINKYLGNYVVKLDKSQLKLGILGGNATLENLDIKENAFDEFDLPIKVLQGHIGKLTLKIPWKHIYSEPVIAELDGLYVLAVPNTGVKYDAEKERLFKQESKQKELSRIEEEKAKRNESKKQMDVKDSFGEKLGAQIIKNLQIVINSIHIRYEDSVTCPKQPFAVGITLANLSFQTCDSSGESIIIKDDTTKEFFKSVKMDSLAVYWNSHSRMYGDLPRGLLKNSMKSTISSSDNKNSEMSYLIRPISCSAMMHVHMRPETTNFSVPQMSMNLTMNQIGFAFTRNQYCDVAYFLDSVDRMFTQNRFRKYRPSVPLHQDSRAWWRFPYSVILEEQVRRRRQMWSWSYIKAHRIKCRTYITLWQQKLLDKKLSTNDLQTLAKCEEELDLLNITLCRQQAEMKAKKTKKKLSQQKESSGGWFSGWFGKSESETSTSPSSDLSDEISNRFRNEFNQEEKAKLYQAIGYSEGSKETDIPKEYVSLDMTILLHKLTFVLLDENLSEKKLMKLSVSTMTANIRQRASANALRVGLEISSMQMSGSVHVDGVLPLIISTHSSTDNHKLLYVDFETNPLNGTSNQKLVVQAEPLEIIYDSETVNRIVKFVTPPEELQLSELSSQVLASIEDVKEMTATGLRHLAQQRLYTEINIDIKPSYIILPEHGSYVRDGKMLIVDLGTVQVRSERTNLLDQEDFGLMRKVGKLDYEIFKETAYDKFHIALSTIQMLLIERGDDWEKLRVDASSRNHLLKPFGFDFTLKKCVITNDINLPSMLIEGRLPHLGVNISDRLLKSLLELVLHIPFPQTEPQAEIPKVEDLIRELDKSPFNIKPAVSLSTNQVIRAAIPHSESSSTISSIDDDSENFYEAQDHFDVTVSKKKPEKSRKQNLVNLDAVFVINTVELQVFEESTKFVSKQEYSKEIIKVIVTDVGTTVTLKRFDMNIQAYVGSLMMSVPQFTIPNSNIPVHLVQTKKHTKDQSLLFLKLIIADKTAPDFNTVYNNTRHTLTCEFKSLDVLLHQEALLMVLNFVNSLLPSLTAETVEKTPDNWLLNIGDAEGAKSISDKQAGIEDDKKRNLPDTSVKSLVSDKMDTAREKRSVRLNAELEAEKLGIIPETKITQWAITASLEKFRLIISSVKENDILEVSFRGMRANVETTYQKVEVFITVNDLRVHDPTPKALYRKMIWTDPNESVFSIQLCLFNQGTSTPGFEMDLNRVDMMINLNVGKIKVIFLYSFVNKIQTFLDSFQTAIEKVAQKAQEYSDTAIEHVANALEDPPSSRIRLQINVNAPVIYIPEDSKSTLALMLDLGCLLFENNFTFAPDRSTILEVSNISLNNLRLSRCVLMETTVKDDKGLLSPINISIVMNRNLSWSKNKVIAQIDVDAKMHSINVVLSQSDYSAILLILQSNFGEAAPSDSNVSNISAVTDKKNQTVVSSVRDGDKKINIFNTKHDLLTKFSFQMEYIQVELFKGDVVSVSDASDIHSDKRLTTMKCEKLSLEGQLFSDNAMSVDVKLSDIKLIDTQPGSQNHINELIRSISKESDFINVSFNIDEHGNTKLRVDIAGIYICICLEYLMSLVDFFVNAQPAPPPPKRVMVPVRGYEENPRKYRKKPVKPPVEERMIDMEIDLHMQRPEILLVEDIKNPESNAILVQTEVFLKYSMLKECDIINGEVKEFHAVFCPFKEALRVKYSLDIISPTNIHLYCKRPLNDGMQGSVVMDHLIVNITPAVIRSVSKIINSLSMNPHLNTDLSSDINAISSEDISSRADEFWDLRPFDENDFSFIARGLSEKERMNRKEDDVEHGFDVAQMLYDLDQRRADQILIRLPDIRVVLESEVAKKCVPMLILECSVDGDMKNPLTKFSIGLTVSISVSYFNDNINIWEPLLETYPDENNRQYSFELEYITCDDSQLFDEEDFEDLTNIEPSTVSILLLSRDNLELTLSKTAMEVLSNLGKAFQEAYELNIQDHRSITGAPYVFKNSCGVNVILYLTDQFDLKACDADSNGRVLLKTGEDIQLSDAKFEKQTLVTEEKKERIIEISYAQQAEMKRILSIYKSEIRAIRFISRDVDTNVKSPTTEMDLSALVVSTTAYLGMKNIVIRSVLQISNYSDDNLSVIFKLKDGEPEHEEKVDAGKSVDVPIPVLMKQHYFIYVQPHDLNAKISKEGISWSQIQFNQIPEVIVLECMGDSPIESTTFYYTATVKVDEIPDDRGEETTMKIFHIQIKAPVLIHNQLPIPLDYQSQSVNRRVKSGCCSAIRSSCFDTQSILKFTYDYQQKDWFGSMELKSKMDELSVINFKAKEGFNELLMDLGVHTVFKDGQASVTIYSPYWMINKTGHNLTYKAGEEYQVYHAADNADAVLFSFLSKSIFSKKKQDKLSTEVSKAHLKIDDSQWSDKFSLDTVGSSGKVICKQKPVNYEVAIKINLSSSALTKIVTFLPYYMIINQSNVKLFCNEMIKDAGWLDVPPGEAVPFWPLSEVGKSMLMRCKVDDPEILVTQPFPFYESHSILMKLEKKYIGIFVEVQITEEANLIVLQLYQPGMALVQLINHLSPEVDVHYKQAGMNQEMVLPAYHSVMYAWQDARQKLELVWRVEGDTKKQHTNNLTKDGIEDFLIHESKAYWVSFISETHRVLLFTNDIHVAKSARLSTELENIDQDITISLQSVGLSLVDNSLLQEVAYISIISSGVKWNQIRRKNRHKPLKVAQSEALELAYDDYVNRVKTGEIDQQQYIVKVEGLEVDLSKKLMIKPEKVELIRTFEPGIFMQYRTSPHQMHIHLRVYRIQIDNQLSDCLFPVVFAPFPPPRSVALDTGLKPLIELSAVIGKSNDPGAMRFKYFRVLIQEMQLMVDQGIINALLDFFSGSVPEYDEEQSFITDCKMIQDSLIDTETIKAILQGGKKCVFDNFHISPIKIHLSFSLTRANRSGKTALHSEVLNLFLQSIGIAVTDMQDVIFKLGYFEKQNSIMPMTQMSQAMQNHYVSQALRQMYVLVLGLDVLGNPFGVIRGMVQGVEDLFYEPVRGAVLGPEEFVEGVAYGVKSLFGHAVGGAAGAVSRIVGTMGKGIAALTLDADYQRKRRENMARRPENFGVGLAQGGKGLITGFVQGVTGVITKPIDGAKKEGVEGFFKGVGKGLVGVVTRPVSGVVDFASSSFEGIRRVADTSTEVVRVRPPRCICKDGIIRCYAKLQAEGYNIWQKVIDKITPFPNESYFFHVPCKHRKNVIFLTNRRIMHLDRNEILGIWSIEWQITYDKLDGHPSINEAKRTIVFTLKEKQRKLFSKDNITKEIEGDVNLFKMLITKIIEKMDELVRKGLHSK